MIDFKERFPSFFHEKTKKMHFKLPEMIALINETLSISRSNIFVLIHGGPAIYNYNTCLLNRHLSILSIGSLLLSQTLIVYRLNKDSMVIRVEVGSKNV